MENFIHSFQVSPEVCDGLIEYHKTNTEYKSKGIVGNRVRNYVKESTDVTFFKNSTDPIIQQYLSELHKAFIEYTTHFKIQSSVHVYTVYTHSRSIGYYRKRAVRG